MEGKALPAPGPHHGHLKAWEGTWEATTKFQMDPSAPASEGKGVETRTVICNGLWLTQDFKGDMMKMPFQGHGVLGYNTFKNQYEGIWVDSMTLGLTVMRGTCSDDGKTLTLTGEGPMPDGTTAKMKQVCELKDKDTQTFTMCMVGDDGKEMPMGTITYKRRK